MPDRTVSVGAVLGRLWTVANALSLARLVLAWPIAWLIVADRSGPLLMALVAAAVLSDWLDGLAARWMRTVGGWGKLLDPLADKIAFAAGGLALAWVGRVPWWFVAVVVARDAILMASTAVVLGWLRHVVPANWLGKLSTIVLAVTLIAALLGGEEGWMDALYWISTPLLVGSAVQYITNDIRAIRHHQRGRAAIAPQP